MMKTGQPETIAVEELQRQIAELQAKLAAAQPATAPAPTISTAGGAAVHGAVTVANGHFIGHDFVQIVNQTVKAGEDAEEATAVIAHYLHALAADLAGLKLAEIDTAIDQIKHSPLQLADIYVPLDTTMFVPKDMTLIESLARNHSYRHDQTIQMRKVSALEALAAHSQLTVLGKPGGGKSTFGANVLLALAQAWQGHAEELQRLGETWTHGALLPIRVILRRFAEELPTGERLACAGDIWAFIARDLDAGGYGLSSEVIEHVKRLARNHGALILLDGLDECGDGVRRQRVMAAVDELMRHAGPKCRFLLTARPYAWPTGPNTDQGVYMLADLDDGQIEQFIRGWYAALVKREWLPSGKADEKCNDLMQARQREDLLSLAENPLLLTLMATLHTNRGRLPDDRADLYHESVELLLLRWNRQIGADKALLDELALPGLKLSDLREALEELAFAVHQQNIDVDGAADVGEDTLIRAFRPLLGNSRDKAAIVIEYIEKRAGLLVGQGEKNGERQFTFPHRTFQEFLAACHLAARSDFPSECARLARGPVPAQWQVVLPLAARLAKAERGASAADELIGGGLVSDVCKHRLTNPQDWTCAVLAASQLLEIGLGAIRKSDRTQAIAHRVAGWLAAALPVHPGDGGLEARRRAQAGDLLARLGDPRFDTKQFHLATEDMLGLVRIAADSAFRIGTRKADRKRISNILDNEVSKYEINDALTPTPEFFIARYPVTVAQFRAFVETSQFEIGEPDALSSPDNRPVCSVNWHEALAYCDWLNEVIGGLSELEGGEITRLVRDSGWRFSLPSELEWEKAARGHLRGAAFPWGDIVDPERANFASTNINNASAVGCFPANDFGLHDMIGNVLEWTRDVWRDHPYIAADNSWDELRFEEGDKIIRGGSCYDSAAYARCAIGVKVPSLSRVLNVGFRFVLRSFPAR